MTEAMRVYVCAHCGALQVRDRYLGDKFIELESAQCAVGNAHCSGKLKETLVCVKTRTVHEVGNGTED